MSRLGIILLVAYVALIFTLSTRPYLHAPAFDFHMKDKVLHFSEYLVLGTLLFNGIRWTVTRDRPITFLFLFAVGVSIGALDEMVQSYVPGRSMDLFDWLADAAGVAVGVGMFVFTSLGTRRLARARRAPED